MAELNDSLLEVIAFLGLAVKGHIWPIIASKYFLLFLGILLIVGVLRLSYTHYKAWKNEWLSELIEKQIINSAKSRIAKEKYFKTIPSNNFGIRYLNARIYYFVYRLIKELMGFPENIKLIYQPSFKSLIIILIVFLFLFFFSHVKVPYENLLHFDKWGPFLNRELDNEGAANIIAVFSGLVAIVFALVIFIAESIRDSRSPERKRVLLKISYLWVIIAFTILSLINFLYFRVNVFGVAFPLVVAAMTIVAFWRVVLYLVDAEYQKNEELKFFKSRIRSTVHGSIRERIGNNILSRKIGEEGEIKIEFLSSRIWLNKKAKDYIFIESERDGWLLDINFSELKQLIDTIEKRARMMGFSVYETLTLPLAASGPANDVNNPPPGDEIEPKKIYLLKKYGDYLPPDSPFGEGSKIIMAIPKKFEVDMRFVQYVRNAIPNIFRFSKSPPLASSFRRELQGTKDQLITSIRSISLGAIEDLTGTYFRIAEEFLAILHRYGGGHSFEQAKAERSNIFWGWNEVHWLSQDIKEFLIIASDTNNSDVMSDIAYLPIRVANLAIRAGDHLLYQQFIIFSVYIYSLAVNNVSDESSKLFLIERSWRYLKESCEYYIEPKLKDRLEENDVEAFNNYKNFALFSIKVFQDILKLSFDKKDFQSFGVILREFSRLYRDFQPEKRLPNAKYYINAIESYKGDINLTQLRERLLLAEARESASKDIRVSRQQVLFALSSMILDAFLKSKDENVKTFFDEIENYVTSDIIELTEIYDYSRSYEAEDFWGWNIWELNYDGGVQQIDVLTKLDKFYSVKALKILGEKDERQVGVAKLPHSRNLASIVENPNIGLLKNLHEIENDESYLNSVLSPQQAGKVQNLIQLLKDAKDLQEKHEEEGLKTEKLDLEKVSDFIDKIKSSFRKSVRLRNIAERFGFYRDRTSETPGTSIPSIGYNRLDQKSAFVKDWHVSYVGWGEHYGQGMANSEDQILFQQIVHGIGGVREISKINIIPEIRQAIKNGDFSNPIVLQTLDFVFEYEESKLSDLFVNRWHKDCPKTLINDLDEFLGVFAFESANVPVVNVYVSDKKLKNKIIVIDTDRFGVLEQYSPVDEEAERRYQDGIFFLRVIDLNEEIDIKQSIVRENPEWLRDREDKDGFLRQHVVVKFYQKFKFNILNPNSGICFDVIDLELLDDDDNMDS